MRGRRQFGKGTGLSCLGGSLGVDGGRQKGAPRKDRDDSRRLPKAEDTKNKLK